MDYIKKLQFLSCNSELHNILIYDFCIKYLLKNIQWIYLYCRNIIQMYAHHKVHWKINIWVKMKFDLLLKFLHLFV